MSAPDAGTDVAQASMPLCATLGITTVEASAELVRLAMDWTPERCTIGGALHGGAVMTLADSAGAVCAFLNLPEGALGTSTIQSATNFLGAVTAGTVIATATPLHAGRSTVVIRVEVHAGDRLVGTTTQTQSVLLPRPSPAGG